MSAPATVPPGPGGAGHQFTLAPSPDLRAVAVSCTCRDRAEREPIGVRPRWAGGEAYRAWLAHLEAERQAEPEPEAGL